MTSDSASNHAPRASLLALTIASLLVGACDNGGGGETPTTPTPAASTRTLVFSGTLTAGGARFYSFSLANDGAVSARLEALEGPNVDPAVAVHMGIGVPSGTTCNSGRSLVRVGGGSDGVAALVSGNQAAGTSCVLIADAGNLVAPATFRVAVEIP